MKQQLMTLLLGAASVFCSCETQLEQHVKSELRAPAYPLVSIDPYTSAWSFTDNLYDGSVKHWSGKDFPLIGVAKVDGHLPLYGNGGTGVETSGENFGTR